MNPYPSYPRYPQDFISSFSCQTMTLAEYGFFNWFLDYAWTHSDKPCHLPNDPGQIAFLLRKEKKEIDEIILNLKGKQKLQETEDKKYLFNARLLHEYEKLVLRSEKYRDIANIRHHKPLIKKNLNANAKQTQCDSNANAMRGEDENDNVIDNENAFNLFWKVYPKKTGKGGAIKAWAKIKQPMQTLALIKAALQWQTRSKEWQAEGGKYIPYPATYLNQMRWMDEQFKTAEERASQNGREETKKLLQDKKYAKENPGEFIQPEDARKLFDAIGKPLPYQKDGVKT